MPSKRSAIWKRFAAAAFARNSKPSGSTWTPSISTKRARLCRRWKLSFAVRKLQNPVSRSVTPKVAVGFSQASALGTHTHSRLRSAWFGFPAMRHAHGLRDIRLKTFELCMGCALDRVAPWYAFVGATLKEVAQAGIARGLFSNESGLGSAPIVAAAAQTKNPIRQALVSSTGVFMALPNLICLLSL